MKLCFRALLFCLCTPTCVLLGKAQGLVLGAVGVRHGD